jgi:hypothetical protein
MTVAAKTQRDSSLLRPTHSRSATAACVLRLGVRGAGVLRPY